MIKGISAVKFKS